MDITEIRSTSDILDFAIENEEEANRFYLELAGKVNREHMANVLRKFAAEEEKHKEKLLKLKKEGTMKLADSGREKVADLKIGDYLVDVEIGPELNYQEALTVAMKKEKASFILYTQLASLMDDVTLQKLFESLAQEEARHKLRFEIEYDDKILIWN